MVQTDGPNTYVWSLFCHGRPDKQTVIHTWCTGWPS